MVEEVTVHEIPLSLPSNTVRTIYETEKSYLLRLLYEAEIHLPTTEVTLQRHSEYLVRHHRNAIVHFLSGIMPAINDEVANMTADEAKQILHSGRLKFNRIGQCNGVVFFTGYIPIENTFEYLYEFSQRNYFN